MENHKSDLTPVLVIDKLIGALPIGETFNIYDENVKLSFPKEAIEYTTVPIWVIKEALSYYFKINASVVNTH